MDKVYRQYKEAKMNPKKLMDELGIDFIENSNCYGMGVIRKVVTTSSFFDFSHQWSPQQIFHAHSVLSSASFSITSATAMSSMTAAINLQSGLHCFLFPDSSILSTLLSISMVINYEIKIQITSNNRNKYREIIHNNFYPLECFSIIIYG